MFTGLVQRVGVFQGLLRSAGGFRLVVERHGFPEIPALGESIAVQGVCLTVAAATERGFEADVLEQTLAATALGSLRPGARVNLERALRLGDRLGGHIVTGHVDGVGRVAEIRPRGRDFVYSVAVSANLLPAIVDKGSVAVDGVSLTVSARLADGFEVNLIPTTLAETSLADRRVGDSVNIETDVIGKYVVQTLAARAPASGSVAESGTLTLERLVGAGFGPG